MAIVFSASRDQQDAIAFLSDPVTYGLGVDRVDIIETHISMVFLAGDCAYKLKRAVKYPYLDFSTEAKRRRACDAEVALNRRTAPDLYLEVRGIGGAKDGTIGWTRDRPAFDWVVVMRRFDQQLLFDSLATTGGLSPRLMLTLVHHIAAFQDCRAEAHQLGDGFAVTCSLENLVSDDRDGLGIIEFQTARLPAARQIGSGHHEQLFLVAR